MRVTFYGVRGSIATPGPTTVRYGGNTVCVEVVTLDGSVIVLDLGTGARELGEAIVRRGMPDKINVFITHGHWDHIMGMPFFAPVYRKDAHLVLYALSEPGHRRMMKSVLFDGDHFPVRVEDIPSRIERPTYPGSSVRVGSAVVTRVPLHHPGGADGFRIDDDDGTSMCYFTDNELAGDGLQMIDGIARAAHDCDLLVHDAQYLPTDMPFKRGWGHSLVNEALDLGRLAEARTIALHHHDPCRDDASLDRVGEHAAAWCREHAPKMSSVIAAEGLVIDLRR